MSKKKEMYCPKPLTDSKREFISKFITEFNRRIYAFILEECRSQPDLAAPVFAKAFDEKEMARISFFINTATLHGDAKGQLAECIENIKSEKAKRIDPKALSPEELMKKLKGELG